MSNTWGPVTNHFRLGIEVVQTPGAVTAATGSVSLRVTIYGQSWGWGHNWTNTLTLGGALSGSHRVSFYSPTGETVTKVLHTATISVPTAYAQTVARSFTASVNGYGAASVSHTHSVGARPYAKPRTPRNPRSEWVADGRARISWQGDYDGAHGAQPWAGLKVLRHTGSDGKWRQIAQLQWSATSYEDNAAPLNEVVGYALVAYNSAGDSAQVSAGTVPQRPAAPRNVAASKNGAHVTVSWTNSAPAGLATGFNVYDANTLVGTAPAGSSEFVHLNADPATVHTYTVAALAGSLESDRSLPSNTVQLLTRPNAPVILAPTADYAPHGRVTVRWQHNPADSSVQTRAELRYFLPGDTWRIRQIDDATQTTVVDTTTFNATPGLVQMQVRTWGAYKSNLDEGASPWSAMETFQTVTPPTVQINNLTDTVRTSQLVIDWGYHQAQGGGQSAVSILLEDLDAWDPVFQREIQGNLSQFILPVPLSDYTDYVLTVRVRSAHGLWSLPARVEFYTAFPAPPKPRVAVSWDAQNGAAVLAITNPPHSGGEPPAVANNVYRSLDGGASWEIFREGAPVDSVLQDYEAHAAGQTQYRVVAVSAIPSTAVEYATLEPTSGGVYISSGPGFADVVRLHRNAALTVADSLAHQEAHYFAGRDLPVFFEGTARRTVLQLTGTFLPARAEKAGADSSALLPRLRRIVSTPGVKLVRDSQTGIRTYAHVTASNTQTGTDGVTRVHVTLTEGAKP